MKDRAFIDIPWDSEEAQRRCVRCQYENGVSTQFMLGEDTDSVYCTDCVKTLLAKIWDKDNGYD